MPQTKRALATRSFWEEGDIKSQSALGWEFDGGVSDKGCAVKKERANNSPNQVRLGILSKLADDEVQDYPCITA
jgi:hypothetical protein